MKRVSFSDCLANQPRCVAPQPQVDPRALLAEDLVSFSDVRHGDDAEARAQVLERVAANRGADVQRGDVADARVQVLGRDAANGGAQVLHGDVADTRVHVVGGDAANG